MKTKNLLIIAAVAVAGLVGFASTQSAEAAKTDMEPRYGFEWTIAPVGEDGQYICDIAVKDLVTGEILSAPRLSTVMGVQGQIRQGGPVDPGNDMQPVEGHPMSGLTIEAEVMVEETEGQTKATYKATIQKDGKLVASDAASIVLP